MNEHQRDVIDKELSRLLRLEQFLKIGLITVEDSVVKIRFKTDVVAADAYHAIHSLGAQ